MAAADDLSELLRPKLDASLQAHLLHIDLASASRVSAARLAQSALPHIGLIEFVPSRGFTSRYQCLYEHSFHGGERERSELIAERLAQDAAGLRSGLAPYHVIGVRDAAGAAIGAAQFSTLPVARASTQTAAAAALPLTVPYLQYIYVRAANRRQDMSELLHTLVLAVARADATARGWAPAVPFTLFETEPPGIGATAAERVQIHVRGGSVALMLRPAAAAAAAEAADGNARLRSAHVQPGLEVGEPPLTLVWALRPNPAASVRIDEELVRAYGLNLMAAYYRSIRDEGFPEANIAASEEIVAKRAVGCSFVLLPLACVTEGMYRNID